MILFIVEIKTPDNTVDWHSWGDNIYYAVFSIQAANTIKVLYETLQPENEVVITPVKLFEEVKDEFITVKKLNNFDIYSDVRIGTYGLRYDEFIRLQ